MSDQKLRGDFAANPRLARMVALALLIGAISSVIAYLLLAMINFFTNLFFFQIFSLAPHSPAENNLGLLVVIVPAIGGLIIGLMARFGSDKIRGHGIPEALEAILFGKSIMQPKVAILKPLSSAISIGSGGPFGAEGPIIMTGGAAGSIIAQAFRLTAAERKCLLVSGAAAGMSAIFAAPVAAVLLAVELLLFEWRPRSLIPVAIASVTAAGLRPYILGSGPIFPMGAHVALPPVVLVFAAIAGIIAGTFSTLISKSLYKLEDAFSALSTKYKVHWMWWPMIGGLAVGLGGYFQPRALGVGYDVIADLLNGRIEMNAVFGLVLIKALIWIIALASGTSGGVLAPLLIMGCALGSIEQLFMPAAATGFWPLISMAAVLGGIMRAPFTAVIFALELTNYTEALPPLLVASVVSYALTVLIMKRSILTEKVARRGLDIFCEYGVDPLETVRVSEAMSRDVLSVPAGMPIEEVRLKFFSDKHKYRGYPVVDDKGALVGVVTSSDILYGEMTIVSPAPASVQRTSPVFTALAGESCRTAAERMAVHGVGRLIIVSPLDPTKIEGILTRSDLLKARFQSYQEEKAIERPLFKRKPLPKS